MQIYRSYVWNVNEQKYVGDRLCSYTMNIYISNCWTIILLNIIKYMLKLNGHYNCTTTILKQMYYNN